MRAMEVLTAGKTEPFPIAAHGQNGERQMPVDLSHGDEGKAVTISPAF